MARAWMQISLPVLERILMLPPGVEITGARAGPYPHTLDLHLSGPDVPPAECVQAVYTSTEGVTQFDRFEVTEEPTHG